ncbi:MAG TPA: AbgT family transporter [Clostridia bacterium]|nr:AbgT family transporter [Clostridia bacterium]
MEHNEQSGASNKKGSLSISVKSFVSVMAILLALMVVIGILTYIVPHGRYERVMVDGREQIVPGSYTPIEGESGYPVWRWFTAPFEVLDSADATNIILIAVLLLVLAGSFSIIENTGGIKAIVVRLIRRFSEKKHGLIWAVSLFFMVMASMFGTFEEMLVLVPLILMLARSMKWDNLTGLSMCLLAAGVGFAVPLLDPFTIGLACRIAGANVLSGIWFRLIIFALLWVLLSAFTTRFAKRYEKRASALGETGSGDFEQSDEERANEGKVFRVYCAFFISIIAVMVIASALTNIEALADISLPVIGVGFLVGTLICGIAVTGSVWKTLKFFGSGVAGMSPGILMLLCAGSVKFIAMQGNILDTIMYQLINGLSGVTPYAGVLLIYFIVLLIEFFIGSASAKLLLVIPIIMPICDMIGISRELAILAFCFGDGFTNVFFPTNAVMLVGLSIADTSYGAWFKRTAPFQLLLLMLSMGFLLLATAIGY